MSAVVDLTIGLGQNMALVLALLFIDHHVQARLSPASSWRRGLCLGLLYSAIAMMGMQLPIRIDDGLFIDARVVLVGLAGAHHGPVAAALTVIIVGSYRMYLGGVGAMPGTISIVGAAACGLAVHRWVGGRPEALRLVHHLVLGLGLAGIGLGSTWLLPPALVQPALAQYLVPVAIAYPLGAIILGELLGLQARSRANQGELRANRERLELATSTAGIGVWDWDIAHDTLVWDDSMYRIFRVDRTRFAGVYDAWLRTVHPEDRANIDAVLRGCLREGREFDAPFRIVWPDGSVRHIRTCSKTFRAADGTPLRMVGVNEDVTERMRDQHELERHRHHLEELVAERTDDLEQATLTAERLTLEAESARLQAMAALAEAKRLEASYQQARDQAEAANRAKSDFLASMSHEIRTPLNAVLGYAQVLVRDPGLSVAQRRAIEAINRSGEHLLALITDILELSRIEAGRGVCESDVIDLPALVDGLYEVCAGRAHDKHLRLRCTCASGVPRWIRSDPRKLRQILLNLLSNALKFTANGSVTLSVVAEDGRLRCHVADTGPGIGADELRQLFQPFAQATIGRRQDGGSGLGLALSRGFAELLGGSITASSTLGAGATFTLDLPLVEAPAPHRAPRQRVTGLAPGQTVRLLVADDHADSRQVLHDWLTALGCTVESVPDGLAAVAACAAHRPDLVFMDIDMPGLDGLSATKRIRSQTGPTPRIVACTAAAFTSDRQRLLDGGCDEVLHKPIREDELFRLLEQLLGLRLLREEPTSADATDQAAQAERLRHLPADERRLLRDAVITGDLAALAAITSGWTDRPLAGIVDGMVARFEFARLQALVEEP